MSDKKKKKKKTITEEIKKNRRLLVLIAIFLLIAVALIGRIFYIQFIWGSELSKEASRQQNSGMIISCGRIVAQLLDAVNPTTKSKPAERIGSRPVR